MQKSYPRVHYFIIFGFVLLLMALGQVSNGQVVWASGTNYQRGTVPTKTPVPDVSSDSDENDGQAVSHILGKVTDLSTGQPGAGVIVQLNDITVRTDTLGKYSLSGLSDGRFTIALILEGNAVPAQEPVTVTVDGKTDVTVDLAYYSTPPQAETTTAILTTNTTPANDEAGLANLTQSPAPEAGSEGAPPQFLPASGTVKHKAWSWILFVGGIVFLVGGIILDSEQRKRSH